MPSINQTCQLTTIDLNARHRFEMEISKGYAGISFVDSRINTVKCIRTHCQEFREGKRGARDSQRAKMHFEAAQLSGGEQRVLSFFLDVGNQGKLGIVVPQEIAADAIRRTTGGACAPRTYRRHMASLCRRGWLGKTAIPTGTRVLTTSGEWKTYKVNKVTLTPASRLLIQKNYISIPRPKRPITEGDIRNRGNALTFPSVSVIDKRLLDKRAHVVERVVSKESPKVDRITSPEPSTAQTVKHGASTSAPRKAANKKAAVKLPASVRKSRASVPKTWGTATRTLLKELFAFFHADPMLDELYRVAELQTDPYYPGAMMQALDWDDIVRRWVTMPWQDRRRAMKNEIAPPLRAFCEHLSPPIPVPPDKKSEITRQHAELCEWLQVIPDKMSVNIPVAVAERMNQERWRINMLIRSIHMGRIPLSELNQNDHAVLQQAGFIWGDD
jgi:hypothetical protein